jgi:leucyl aminopeptidase (aminopeptidase T)
MVRAPRSTLLTISLALAVIPSAITAQGYPTLGDSSAAPAISRESARRFQKLAPRLVQSARIQPGDLVTISGGPLLIPEMEALGLEVQRAGGRPILLLDSPRLIRSLYAEVPEEHIRKSPTSFEKFSAQNVAVSFFLPTGEDFATMRRVARRAKVDAELAKLDASTAQDRNKGTTRNLFIAVPTPSDTASIQMDYAPYEAMAWKAIEADYSAMRAKGEAIKRVLENAKRLRITSPEGTDFTVELGDRPIVVSAGMVPPGTKGTEAARSAGLPGGTVRFAPIEQTANGKIRAAEDQCNQPVRDAAVDVRNGMPENVRSATDEECLKESFKDAGRFGSIVIGLNPAVRYERVPSYGPQLETAAGMVSIGFGPNQGLGGSNEPTGGGWLVPLLKATVEADGKVIVKDGRLM